MLDSGLDQALKELIEQWNIAERRIKKAEQVRGGEVVASAIFELRYAGRKLIDAIDLSLKNDLANDHEARKRVHASLVDSKEDCVKSKHDAIDAIMDFVTVWFRDAEKGIGLSGVVRFFPNYLETSAKITEIQDKIAASREDRNVLRDSIYDEIERDYYDQILELYGAMLHSHNRVQTIVRRENWKGIILWILTILGVGFGLWGVLK